MIYIKILGLLVIGYVCYATLHMNGILLALGIAMVALTGYPWRNPG